MADDSLGIGAKLKKLRMSAIDPNKCYPMTRRSMGHAVIVNNVDGEFPNTRVDVEELETTYRTMGFQVHIHNDCDNEKMRQIKRWLLNEATHKDSNCVAITLICHGNEQGWLLDKDKRRAWILEDFVADLGLVENLMGRPKLMVVQACRGSTSTEGRRAPSGVLSVRQEVRDQIILPDKADLFIAFATVPGYVARAGDEEGSHYLQAFATFLREQYLNMPLDRIYLMVKQYMTHMAQGQQCSEERNSLRYLLNFNEYHQKNTKQSPKPSGSNTKTTTNIERREEPRKVVEKVKTSVACRAKSPEEMDLTLIVNKDPGLMFWGHTKFTIMPSTGNVILWGKASASSGPKFHIYKSTSEGLTKQWTVSEICSHHESISILPIRYKQKEQLAISCIFCNNISIYDQAASKFISVFNDKKYYPTKLIQGEAGVLYAAHYLKGVKPVMELTCSEPNFTADGLIKTGVENIASIAYIPSKKYIITANKATRAVRAISKFTEEHVWAKTFTWNKIDCVPGYVLYVKERDMLLVADGPNSRIMAINYETGAFQKVIQLDKSKIGYLAHLCWHNGQLVVHHNLSEKTLLAYYSVD